RSSDLTSQVIINRKPIIIRRNCLAKIMYIGQGRSEQLLKKRRMDMIKGMPQINNSCTRKLKLTDSFKGVQVLNEQRDSIPDVSLSFPKIKKFLTLRRFSFLQMIGKVNGKQPILTSIRLKTIY